MQMKKKILYTAILGSICILNPSCKHSTNDAQDLYRRYAIKNLQVIKKAKKL